MNFAGRYIKFVDSLSEKTGQWASWLTTILVLVVCYDVFTRYLLEESSVAVQELEWHLFAIIFLLGAAFTLKYDRHVRVDLFYTKMTPVQKAWVDLLGNLLFLIPFSILVIWASWSFVVNSFMIGEESPDPGGLPARYILKAIIPVSFCLLLLQGLALIFKCLLTVWQKNQPGKESE